MKVRIVSIGYSTVFDDNAVNLHVWQEFESKQKAIDWIEKKYSLAGVHKKELNEFGCTMIGREHYFILYPSEQKQWIKTLVKELL